MWKQIALLFAAILVVARFAVSDEPLCSQSEIRTAVQRAIPLLETGSAGSAEQRTCFTCHNQALPILALTAARRHGFGVDEANLQRQLKHTLAHLERGKQDYLAGKGQGGRSITAGYALWALEAGGHAADDTTAAVTSFLLQYQKSADHWSHPGNRPPSSGSDFTTTALALRGIQAYGTTEQQPEIQSRVETVRQWLVESAPYDTEDRVFRLHALRTAGLDDELKQQAAAQLLASQRGDGGWAQTGDMESDAYATGTVLVALLQSTAAARDDKPLQRGLRFLLDTQCEDGSWHVTTRAKPFQTYYESGFPHDEDQFISIAASSWAALALVLSLQDGDDCK